MSLINFKKLRLTSAINLIRLEIFFAIFFAFISGVYLADFTDLNFNRDLTNYLALIFLVVAIFSLFCKEKKVVRLLSNIVYFSGFLATIYVVYDNRFDIQALSLFYIIYSLYCFSIPNSFVFKLVNSSLIVIIILAFIGLNFETKTPIYFIFLPLLLISGAGYFSSKTRSYYKASIIKRDKYLQEIFYQSSDIQLYIDKDLKIIDVNKSLLNEFLYSKEELLKKPIEILLNKKDNDFLTKISLAKKNLNQEHVLWCKRKDGTEFPIRVNIKKGLLSSDKVIVISGKNVEEELLHTSRKKKSENKYRNLVNSLTVGVIITNNNKIVFANKYAIKLLKYKNLNDLIGLDRSLIIDIDDIEVLDKRIKTVRQGSIAPSKEFVLKTAAGENVYVESKASSILFEGNECIIAYITDITDRKIAEKAQENERLISSQNKSLTVQLEYNRNIQRKLRDSQSLAEGIIESSLDIIFTTNREGKITKLNLAGKNQLQYPSNSDFINSHFKKFLYDETVAVTIISELNYSKSFLGEVVFKRKDGSTLNVYLSISYLYNLEKDFLGLMGVCKDITEITKQRKEIINQSNKLNSIIESSSHFFFTLNKKLKITSFNKPLQKDLKTNLGTDLTIGSNFYYAFDNNEFKDFWTDKFSRAFKGESVFMETKREGLDGKVFYRDVYLSPVFNEIGEVEEISGIAHNVTQKRIVEIELKKSLQEKEILLQEVHHRVKNNMQVISSILNLQSSFVQDKNVLAVLKESQNRIAAMASIHERLYKTKNFSEINFTNYVKDLAETILNTYELSNTSVEMVFSLDEILLSLDTAIPCGLIINELLSNCLKYAFVNKDYGKIDLELYRQNELISISLKDNGVGLPENLSVSETNTLGLQLVNTLVQQIEGNLIIERKGGTKFTITFQTD